MIFFFKSDGTLIKSAPETVYQGSAEAGKVYVVAPLNANMLVDVYYELPNGERWGAYLLENNGTVINNKELPDGWALWSTTLESAITQYAGTLKAQFGFYQSGKADKVPLITSQGVTIKIAKGVVRDVSPDSPIPSVYEYLTSTISTIKQNFDNLPNEYLSNTNEDKIALKNNKAIEYSENATTGTIVKRDNIGKINVNNGTEDLNAVNVGQLNAALEKKVDSSSVSSAAVKNTIAQRTETGQLKAADGVADDDLATIKQLNSVQGNCTDITNIDLNTGDTTVQYDIELGITVNAKGTVTHKNGNTEQPTTKFELPIIACDGIVIDKAADSEKVQVSGKNFIQKVTTSSQDNRVYGVDTQGEQYIIPTSQNVPQLGNVAQYTIGNNIRTNTPIDNLDAANKKYVDDTFVKKITNNVYSVLYGNSDNDEITVRYSGYPLGNTIPVRIGNGRVQTTSPSEDLDAANKKYVDDAIVAHLVGVYTYKGSKDTYANLPATGNNVGDVWNVEDTGTNYAWDGTNWDSYSANVLDSTGNSTVQAMSQKATTDELNKKVNTSDNFVKAFTIPNGVSTGTLTPDVKQKLCNPDGHNYYVYDDTSEMILKYSFNGEDEIIQYKEVYFVNDKAYDITMQILPSNGSWRRSQTVLNGATANPTLTGTEAELTGLKVGGTNYKIPASGGEKVSITVPQGATNGTITDELLAKLQANESNYIEMVNDKELYYLNDPGHEEGFLTYSHVGIENSKATIKTLTITVSAKSFVIVKTGVSTDVGGKLYRHRCIVNVSTYTCNLTFFDYQSTPHTIESAFASPRIGYSLSATIDMKVCFGIIESFADNGFVQWYLIPYSDAMTGSSVDTYSVISIFGQQITSLTDTVTEI